jgi:probable phosphoglycerate mutase
VSLFPVFDPRLEGLVRLASATRLRLQARSFHFLRHGETEGNRTKIVQGAGIPLNDRGREQAREAAARLRGQNIQRIYASTMNRAAETGAIVGETLGLKPTPCDALREKWFGDWVGTDALTLDWDKTPPNGEALPDFVERTRRGAEALLGDGAPGTLLVAHGGNLHVLAAALGIRMTPELAANATPILFRREGEGWSATPLAHPAPPSSGVPA